MDELRDRLMRGDIVHDLRRLLRSGAEDHGQWIRTNLRQAIRDRRQDAVAISALTGLAPGTVRGFLNGRPSSLDNVLLIAQATGYTLGDLDREPDEFRARSGVPPIGQEAGALGASLLAFDESPSPMAITLMDGTILKVNRALRELLGYEEAELIGSSGVMLSASTEADRSTRSGELVTTGEVRGRVTKLRAKDGTQVPAITNAVVVRDEDGLPRYVIGRASLADERALPEDPDRPTATTSQ